MVDIKKIAIIGAGNIGSALAEGLSSTPEFQEKNIYLTRRSIDKLETFSEAGFKTTGNNIEAVRNSSIIILCIEPQQAQGVLKEIGPALDKGKHLLISIVSGLSIAQIRDQIQAKVNIIRAMPNTAIVIGEAMTCLAAQNIEKEFMPVAKNIFNTVGETLIIKEEQMAGATSLGACGIAFFLRAIRAASQGGIEIGFHAEEALKIAAHTAKGASALLTSSGGHPESEIDRVTTPRGCTISGLNEMEHSGFSSALIKGIKISADKAARLYTNKKD